MNVNEATSQLVQAAIAELLENIRQQISEKVYYEVNLAVSNIDIHQELHKQIQDNVGSAVTTYHWPNDVPSKDYNEDAVVRGITQEFKSRTHEFLHTLTNHVQQKIIEDVYGRLAAMDYQAMVRDQVNQLLSANIQQYNFPANSIPAASVNTADLQISASQISGGTIRRFESTGIQDSATRCQLTILDEATVFENRLVSRDIEIAGSATFNGTLNFNGALDADSAFVKGIVTASVDRINSEYSSGFYDQYCNRVIDHLGTQGIDSGLVRVGNQKLVEGERLAGLITESNLQKVGALRELQVVGETLLDETVYVSNRRLGINTMEPERVLDLWDQEVQITMGKRQQNVAAIATPRNQQLIIGTGNRDQLVLNTDGSVTVQQLEIGRLRHGSSSTMPTDNRPLGTVIWNERPQIGESMGWVSLGGARWARFGTITE